MPRLTRGSVAKQHLTIFPPFESQDTLKDPNKHDSPLELDLNGDFFENATMASASSPYIKSEPTDFGFDNNPFNQFNQGHSNSHPSTNNNMNINPASLNNGNGNMSQSYMGSSFNMGNSGIADDELLDLQLEQNPQQLSGGFDFNSGMQNFFTQQQPQQQQQQQQQQQKQMQQQNTGSIYSHTPDGAPIQSPFTSEFNYGQFRPMPNQQQFAGAHSMPQQSGLRPHLQHLDRKVSDSRSPATPNTPGVNLQVGDEFAHPAMPIHHRQHSSIGNGWDSTPSGHSWENSSPFPSPANGHLIHPQISEVLKNNVHPHKVASSLPTKMEPGTGMPAFSAQEAKRRRRRESHNMVERRRRDNINERIHDLGTLVPQHRLEDEKVRKHLQTNAPLSPSIANATGMSPPNAAASLLAGSQARRSTGAGNITQGLPADEKDKGPNKGDILNGSVAWTRDMMWYTQLKMRQEQELKELVQQLGGVWPFEQSDDEKRMQSELFEVFNKHSNVNPFTGYSRAPGSGLRVPGFTNVAGDTINGDGQATGNGSSGPLVSPGFQSNGSAGISHSGANSFWSGEFKEEDEYGMELQ